MIAPKGAKECSLLLAKAANERQKKVLEIKPVDELDFFSSLMIFGEIIIK
jgi:hypothetical protein